MFTPNKGFYEAFLDEGNKEFIIRNLFDKETQFTDKRCSEDKALDSLNTNRTSYSTLRIALLFIGNAVAAAIVCDFATVDSPVNGQ